MSGCVSGEISEFRRACIFEAIVSVSRIFETISHHIARQFGFYISYDISVERKSSNRSTAFERLFHGLRLFLKIATLLLFLLLLPSTKVSNSKLIFDIDENWPTLVITKQFCSFSTLLSSVDRNPRTSQFEGFDTIEGSVNLLGTFMNTFDTVSPLREAVDRYSINV